MIFVNFKTVPELEIGALFEEKIQEILYKRALVTYVLAKIFFNSKSTDV